MIVGPTGGGKTTSIKVLAESMTQLRNLGSEDTRFQVIKQKVLNPKSISMGELYGEENMDTQEWTDGLEVKSWESSLHPKIQTQSIGVYSMAL